MTPEQEAFKERCDELRDACGRVEQFVRDLTPDIADLPIGTEVQEVNAHLMLAVRHLEDARMRLGKAIQYASQGGVSVFEQTKE